MNQPQLDFTPARQAMARRSDPDTSHEAADVVLELGVGTLQWKVLDAFRRHGPMTARAAERLPEFADYGFSTIRKRISELASDEYRYLVPAGVDRTRRSPATIYAARK